ncbi:SNF2-related protein [Georgenia sp. Z1344]|uniref:DEAD/DEAH box helicase n=1 Tax=Georgenia sp. Z1344 TaxID=3416706 RepID=UPI003CEFB044
MPQDVVLEWVSELTDGEIEAALGSAALERAQGLAGAGHVADVTTNGEGSVVVAQVVGSQGDRYTVVVRADIGPSATVWHGSCTCPVASSCKHVGAVLLELRDRARRSPDGRGWEDILAPIVADGAAAGSELAPLGLQVSEVQRSSGLRTQRLAIGSDRGAVPRLRLRPVVRGRSGRWLTGGRSWSSVTTGYTAQDYVPDHVRALSHLKASAHGTRPEWQRAEEVYLDELDANGWHALVEAYVAGVDLVGGQGVEQLQLAPGATLGVDLTGAGDGIRVTPYVEVDLNGGHSSLVGPFAPAERPGSRVTLEGDPACGVSVRYPDGAYVLAPLDHAIDANLRDLTLASVVVPESDRTRFTHGYLPRLRQRIAVRSSDSSVEIPDALEPHVLLTVTMGPAHRSRVELGFRYVGGDRHVDVPLRGGELDLPRDAATESGLLTAVAREISLVPRLHPPEQATVDLTPAETAVLVDRVVPRMREAGIVVEVVGDAADFRRATEVATVSVASAEGLDTSTDWLDLRVSVHVGTEEVPVDDLLQALATGADLVVLPSGTYLPLDTPELNALRRLVSESRALTDAPPGTVQVSRYRSEQLEELAHLDLLDEEIAAWTDSLQALADIAGRPTPEPPAGLDATLRPYQREGYSWLSMLWDARAGGILADDMGLGKTLQTLAAIQRGKERGEVGGLAVAAGRGAAGDHGATHVPGAAGDHGAGTNEVPDGVGPVLVVCPTSVIGTWVHEAERFAPGLEVVALRATGARREEELAEVVTRADVVVTSYAIVRLDIDELAPVPWSALVLDEAQFVKNPRTATHRAVSRLRAPRRLAMTGTPVENSVADLWSILALVTPGLLPKADVFTATFRRPIEAGTDPEPLEELRRRIRPFVLRRTKELVERDLPPKQEQVVYVELSAAHRRSYDRHLQRERQRILGLLDDIGRNRVSVLSSLTTLRLAALDPALADREGTAGERSTKIDTLLDHLGAVLAEGHRVLVFSQFTSFLAAVRTRLEEAGISHLYLDGSTRDREGVVQAFRDGEAPVFLISLKAGGFGLTLTEADYVYLLDPWWNPAAENQAVDRTHRIGQDRRVNVYRLVSAGTIEEKVLALQDRKRDLVSRVVGDGGALSAPLTPEDVRDLLEH